MFKRILVPLDGSDLAERAVPVAARLAKASGGTVILLQVVALPVETGKAPIVFYNQQAIDHTLAIALDYLEHVAQSSTLAQCAVEIQSLAGATASTIISAIQSFQADIVVVCSHSYPVLQRWTLGSVAQKVARHSPVPVLILRAGQPSSLERQSVVPHPMTALVSLDGSSLSETALEPAATMLAAFAGSDRAVLHLLGVVPTYGHLRNQTPFDAEIKAQEKQEAETYLKSVKERLSHKFPASSNLTLTTSVVVHADIAEAILQTAERGQNKEDLPIPAANFIVMATHGRGGLRRWIVGSVTERVLHRAPLPLLIVRPGTKETQTGYAAQRPGTGQQDVVVEDIVEIGRN
ncbi:MAG TPA: universal stress protein [Ktedonobacteraceae bacterium]|nr:universal stress protein [Ktedonobacteraceae bacterium]